MIVATRTELYSVGGMTSELERLAWLAAIILNQHINNKGTCAVCHHDFPCDSAVLAEHNAALL